MAKYSKEIVNHICKLISSDSYTVEEICSLSGINEATYYRLKKYKNEFCEAIKKAQEVFNEFIIAEAQKSLLKKVRGYTVQEKRTVVIDTGKLDENGNAIFREKENVITDKHFQPDTAAIIFTLCNRDPDNWKNRQDTNLSGEMKLVSELEKLPDEDLKNIIRNGSKTN